MRFRIRSRTTLPELPSDPVEALARGNRERGIARDGSSCGTKWSRDSYIPWVMAAAPRDAIDPWEERSGE